VRGEVKVKSFTADPDGPGAYGPVEDEAGQRRWRLKIVGAAKGTVVARLDGVADRNAAEALIGTQLYVPRAALPAPDEEEFYHADLIGLTVEAPDGTVLGKVTALHDFGAGDLLEVALAAGGSVLWPFTRQVVPVVDVAGGRVVVDPPHETEVKSPGDTAHEDGENGGKP